MGTSLAEVGEPILTAGPVVDRATSTGSAMIASTSLEGTVAVVTGAARGIGRAIALELAAAGADVGVGLRDVEQDNGVVAEIEALGRRAVALPMDVTDLPASRAAIDRA